MVDHATNYARDVVAGRLIASKLVIQQCKKHIHEVENGLEGYVWHPDKANRVIQFAEMLPDISSGEPLILASFQKFIIGSLSGWLDDEGNKRYRRSYISMSRKNGKSLLISPLLIYEMIAGELPNYGRQIYCTANARSQAMVLFKMVTQQMDKLMSKSKPIRQSIHKTKQEINHTPSYSLIKPLSSETSNLDGFAPTIGVLDEFHESKDSSMVEVLESGMILQPNGMIIIISTAGFHLNGPMYKEYQYVKKILDGSVKNDNYFVFIAEQDSEEEVHDEEMWIKSNPLMELEGPRKLMITNIKVKLNSAEEEIHKTLVKNFNLWQSAGEDSYINASDWEAAAIEEEFDITGRDVWFGIDLARVDDLAAVSTIYPTDDKRLFVDSHTFVASKGGIERKSTRDKIDYELLAEKGYATITNLESGVINYTQIIDYIVNLISNNNLNVKGVLFDRWGVDMFLAEMELKHGHLKLPMVQVEQDYKSLSEPIKRFRTEVYGKNIVHKNNPNLNIAINNAIVRYDNNGNAMLDKKINRNKIDPIIALVTAYSQAMFHEFDNSVDFEAHILSDDFGF